MSDDLIRRSDVIKALIEWYGCKPDDIEAFEKIIENIPSADRPSGYIHIDDVYRLIAGHSDYHGDSILSAFTCLTEGKEVKPIKPLDRPLGEWILHFDDIWPEESTIECSVCHEEQPLKIDDNFCPNCGAKMKGTNNE